MNETVKNLLERRSIRKYLEKEVPDELIEEIVKCGTYAPTGKGMQSPIILVIKDKETRDKISKINASILGTTSDPFYGAPVVIIVLANKEHATYIYDGSCVMENLMVAAHSLGLGSCWIHRAKETFETEEGKQILKDLNIVGDYEGIGNCIIGYPAGEMPVAKDRKDNYIYVI